uniref:B30.2/SPRY domain-containing protein n=1 Tax=Salvator merianae TaxID=96440 RepID=A0A8D0DKL8_SALMN
NIQEHLQILHMPLPEHYNPIENAFYFHGLETLVEMKPVDWGGKSNVNSFPTETDIILFCFALPVGFFSPAVSVTLDPDTAHPCLFISEDRRSVKREESSQRLPFKPGRFDTMWCVLGCEKFMAGRHCWDVELKENQAGWVVGVARESVKRTGIINFSPEEGVWAIQCCFYKTDNPPRFQVSSLTSPLQTIISRSWKLSIIRVSLDYEVGCVAFSDVCSSRSIFTFSSACFAGERVCPFFRVFHGSTLKCC